MPELASQPVLAVALAVLLGGGLYVVAGGLLPGRTSRIERQLARVTTRRTDPDGAGRVGRLVVGFGRRLIGRSEEVREIARLARNAGLFAPSAPYQFAALQLGNGVLLALVAGTLSALAQNHAHLAAAHALGGLAVGYLAPRYALRVLGVRRRRRVAAEIPFFLDMLLLLLRSGAGIERCFREIVQLGEAATPEIHRTLTLLINDLDQGRPYEAALDRWAERMSAPAAGEIARQLQQALVHGTELSRSLAQCAARLTQQQIAGAREAVGKRSTYITVLTLMFFLPPLMIVLAAPGFTNLTHLMTSH